jgi:hypothetical protein
VPFNEVEVLNENFHFVFENMPTVKAMKVLPVTPETAYEQPTHKSVAENATPGKPTMIFF